MIVSFENVNIDSIYSKSRIKNYRMLLNCRFVIKLIGLHYFPILPFETWHID